MPVQTTNIAIQLKNLHHFLFILTLILIAISLTFSSDIRSMVFRNTQIDTIGHFIGFFCLTWVLSSLIRLPMWPLTIALIFYAALSELGQYYLGFRNGEMKDFIADLFGIFMFVLLKWVWLVYGKKLLKK